LRFRMTRPINIKETLARGRYMIYEKIEEYKWGKMEWPLENYL